MFPFFEILGLKIYATGVGIIIFLICFIAVSRHLCQKRHQDFYKLFYRLPIAIVIIYLVGSYSHFVLNYGLIPQSIEQAKSIISPYGYKFHFTGLLLGLLISLFIFFKGIARTENKKVWADIFFFSISLSMIPFGIFLLLGDNFVGKPNTSRVSVKPLTMKSDLNKFGSVYPIGIFLSIAAILSTLIICLAKRKVEKFGLGVGGAIILLISLNIIFLFQQYPKYGVTSIRKITFDIKNYVSFFSIMLFLHLHYKWRQKSQ